MFHLNYFKIVGRETWGKLLVLLALVALVSAGIINQQQIRKTLTTKFGLMEQVEGPYFYAIVQNDVTAQQVRRKLLELPGLDKVSIINAQELGRRMNHFVDRAVNDSEIKTKMTELLNGQIGMKINFQNSIDAKSIALITSYFQKITEGAMASMGPVVDKRNSFLSSTWLSPLLDNLDLVIFLMALPLVVLMGTMLAANLRNALYLYNRYQRNRVNNLVFSVIFCSIVISPLMATMIMSQVNALRTGFMVVALFSSLILLMIGRMRGWRTN